MYLDKTTITDEQKDKFKFICKIMDLVGDTEPKKHGYYKVLNCGNYRLSLDTYNGCYSLSIKDVNINLEDFIDILHREVLENWKIPSVRGFGIAEIIKIFDVLYIKDVNYKNIIDKI